jgi:hypothetical protein
MNHQRLLLFMKANYNQNAILYSVPIIYGLVFSYVVQIMIRLEIESVVLEVSSNLLSLNEKKQRQYSGTKI